MVLKQLPPLLNGYSKYRWQVVLIWLVDISGRTGVEMEALTAASVAALTFYDMCKSVTKCMVIESVYLLEKTGGKSGDYRKKD